MLVAGDHGRLDAVVGRQIANKGAIRDHVAYLGHDGRVVGRYVGKRDVESAVGIREGVRPAGGNLVEAGQCIRRVRRVEHIRRQIGEVERPRV